MFGILFCQSCGNCFLLLFCTKEYVAEAENVKQINKKHENRCSLSQLIVKNNVESREYQIIVACHLVSDHLYNDRHKCPKTRLELEPAMARRKGRLRALSRHLGISKKRQLGGNRWFYVGRNIFPYRSPLPEEIK